MPNIISYFPCDFLCKATHTDRQLEFWTCAVKFYDTINWNDRCFTGVIWAFEGIYRCTLTHRKCFCPSMKCVWVLELVLCLLYRAGSCWCCMRCVVPGARGSSDPQVLAPVGRSSCAVTLLHHRRRCSQSKLTTRSPHSRLTDPQNTYHLHFTRYKSLKHMSSTNV